MKSIYLCVLWAIWFFFLWMSQQYEFIHTSKCSIFHFKLVHQRSSPISVTLLTKLVAASFFCLDVYVAPGGSFSGLLVNMSIQQQLLYSNLAVYGELHKQNRLVREMYVAQCNCCFIDRLFYSWYTYMLFLMIEQEWNGTTLFSSFYTLPGGAMGAATNSFI